METLKEFAARHLELLFGIAVVGGFLIAAGIALKRAKKIDRDGIETDAVVSGIVSHYNPGTHDTGYTIYVSYTADRGERIESPLALDPKEEYTVGQTVRIKYVPGMKKMVRPAAHESE